LFIDNGVFFTSVFLLIFLISSRRSVARITAGISLVTAGGVYALYALINSRLETFTLLLFIGGIILAQSKSSNVLALKNILAVFIIFLSFIYAFRVASNIRSDYISEGIRVSDFNPFYNLNSTTVGVGLAKRLNGIDLMARMTPSAIEDYFSKGESWRYPLIAKFGPIFNPEYVNELKMERMTTTKQYLMKKYTSIESLDYPSCRLVGPYGNFGPFGFLLAAAVLGILYGFGVRWFYYRSSPFLMILGLYILFHLFRFELSFISIFIDWVTTLPILLVFIILNPLKIKRIRKIQAKEYA
jgi:hypothetical protein